MSLLFLKNSQDKLVYFGTVSITNSELFFGWPELSFFLFCSNNNTSVSQVMLSEGHYFFTAISHYCQDLFWFFGGYQALPYPSG
jgi:hypothetical protein